MADAGIKKIILKSAELPFIQFDTVYNQSTLREEIDELFYNIRYRIRSTDQNLFSHWSQIEKFVMPDVTTPFPYTTSNRISIEKTTGHVNVIWSSPQASENPSTYEAIFNKINVFDIWVRWNVNNTTNPNDVGWTAWEYETTVSSNVWSVLPPPAAGYKSIDVAIQVPTTIKIRDYNNNKLTLFRAIKSSL